MNKGDHYLYSTGSGSYSAIGNKPFSILIGDPVTHGIMGYFAADDSFSGVAKEFYSYVSSDQDVIMFAYSGGVTEIVVEEWDGTAWVFLEN